MAQQDEKVVHIRLEDTFYRKLAKEAKRYKRSLPNMAKYLLYSFPSFFNSCSKSSREIVLSFFLSSIAFESM